MVKPLGNIKLINIHIINDEYAVINGNTNKFMSRLNQMEDVNKEVKPLIQDKFELETIEGFSTRMEAYRWLKENHPNIKTWSDRELIIDKDEYGNTLIQLHPDTEQVLVVYKSMYGFAGNNGFSTIQFEKAVNNDIILSGYKWKTANAYDYPITQEDYTFVDPLNKGNTFVVKISGKGSKNNKQVIRTNIKTGETTEFRSIRKAGESVGINTHYCKVAIEKNQEMKGYKFKYK